MTDQQAKRVALPYQIAGFRVVLLLLAVSLSFVVLQQGLSDLYARRVANGDAEASTALSTWGRSHPSALYQLAKSAAVQEDAEGALVAAYLADRTKPAPLLDLAERLARAGDTSQSDRLIDIASRLAPSDPIVQSRIAGYWVRAGSLEQALQNLSTVLTLDAWTRPSVFPYLVVLLDDPDSRQVLAPFISLPAAWWSDFYVYATTRAKSLDGLRYAWAIRAESSSGPPEQKERIALVQRLRAETASSEAYLLWVNGLSHAERRQLGLIYNGGFEIPITGTGFDWHALRHRRSEIRVSPTPGSSGASALKVRLLDNDEQFADLYQPLFLHAGNFQFSGLLRTDGLSQNGLRWEIRCTSPRQETLGRTGPLAAAPEWSGFSVTFAVPADCNAQELRLTLAGNRSQEIDINGSFWFDDLRIVPTASSTHSSQSVSRHEGNNRDSRPQTIGTAHAIGRPVEDLPPAAPPRPRAFLRQPARENPVNKHHAS